MYYIKGAHQIEQNEQRKKLEKILANRIFSIVSYTVNNLAFWGKYYLNARLRLVSVKVADHRD